MPCLMVLVVCTLEPMWADEAPIPINPLPKSGAYASFDREVTAWMRAHQIPGASLAVARGGRIVLARGYGYSSLETFSAVTPRTLFRIASVSKPVTAVALLHLLESRPVDREGLPVSLDTQVLRVLPLVPPSRSAMDSRWEQVTLRHLLHHTGGWDRDTSFDPMLPPFSIAECLAVPAPASADDIVRYMLGQPLDFDPGSRHVYSNFGYCLLGRVIEGLAGVEYEEYVRSEVLSPLGINTMRIGGTTPADRLRAEATYYDGRLAPCVAKLPYAAEGDAGVPYPYGGFALESMDAHGGWVASAVDLVRFGAAFDSVEACPVLSAESVRTMFARPRGPAGYEQDGSPRDAYYAMGWMVRPQVDELGHRTEGLPGHANHWHNGLLPGTASLLVRRHDGLTWAIVANRGYGPEGETVVEDIDPALHRAADAIREWL